MKRLLSACLRPGLCAWLALCSALASGAPAAAQPGKRGGSVVFVMGSDPAMTNPVLTTAIDVGQIGCTIYQGLTTLDRDGVPSPLLAKSWTISPDGLTYTFTLNKANWQDGKPFDSADVKFSLLEANSKYNPIFGAAGRAIAGIDTPAPDSVVIRLKHAFGPLLISLACSHGGAILPRHVFEGTDIPSNKASTTSPIGTGAFKLAGWTRGDNVRLVRNPDYWEAGKPYLDEVIGKSITQPAARAQALLAGTVDFLAYSALPATDYPVIRANTAFRLSPAPVAPGLDLLFLNTRHPPLDDKRVRQALFVALDRDFIVKSAFRGVGRASPSPFGGAGWFATRDIDYGKTYAFDPARANRMLDEAGIKRGADGTRFGLRFTHNTDDAESASLALAVQSMWRAVGVKVTIDSVERTTAAKRVYQDGDFDAFVIAYTSYFDPALGLARAWSSAQMGKPYGNPTGFSSPQVDQLFEKAAALTGQPERAAAYASAQKVLAEELPVLSLRDKTSFEAGIVKLKGLDKEGQLPTWRDAWIEK